MDPQKKMMGFETPGDQRVPISVREWNGLRLALWRSRVAWEIAMREAAEIVDRCRHADGCPGATSETEPCLGTDLVSCADREQRMSALVILNAARQFAPLEARRPANDPYFAPSREFFSEVMAELASTQAELAALRAILGAQTPAPQQTPAQLEETT